MTSIALSREEAAAFVGVGVTSFDRMVAAKTMPAPRRMAPTFRLTWDRDELAAAYRALPRGECRDAKNGGEGREAKKDGEGRARTGSAPGVAPCRPTGDSPPAGQGEREWRFAL